MSGLLLKDLYMLKKYGKMYVLMFVLILGASVAGEGAIYFLLYPCILGGLLPATLLSYDERSHWNSYSGTLPYRDSWIVGSKYILGFCIEFGVVILSGGAQIAKMYMVHNFQWDQLILLAELILSLGLIGPALSLPFVFKLGVEKGRIAYFAMLVIVGAEGYIFRNLLPLSGVVINQQYALIMIQMMGILCVAAVLLYGLSASLSIWCYKNRK